jgi:hypothetical protein
MNHDKTFIAIALCTNSDDNKPIEVVDFNGAMAVCAEDAPIIITKEQAMAFFDLVPKQPLTRKG